MGAIESKEVTFKARITDYAGWTPKLDELCERLEAAGFRVHATRLDQYRKTFATIIKFTNGGRADELPNKISKPLLVNDIHESQEFVESCDQFPDLNEPGLRVRLEKALKGARELEKETPKKDGARNYLFELVMTALLKQAGLKVKLDGVEDVRFDFHDKLFFMECKRIHSIAMLRQNINEAASQLRMRFADAQTEEARGIVSIDISKLLNTGGRCLECSTLEELNSEVTKLVEMFKQQHRRDLGPTRDERVIGLFLYARVLGEIFHPPGCHTCRRSTLIGYRQGRMDKRLIERFLKIITPGFMHY